MQQLRELGQLDETLIVLTTDHAGQPSKRFHGVDAAGRGDFNWYYGTTLNGTFLQPSPALAPLIATGNVRFSYQDSAIRTWLTDTSDAAKREAAKRDGDAARRDRHLPAGRVRAALPAGAGEPAAR